METDMCCIILSNVGTTDVGPLAKPVHKSHGDLYVTVHSAKKQKLGVSLLIGNNVYFYP